MTASRIKYAPALLLIAAVALATAGCSHPTPSSDPASNLYRKPGVDFNTYETVVYEFTDITTTNGKAVDVAESNLNEGLHMWLSVSGLFEKVMVKGEGRALGKTVYIRGTAKMHWGRNADPSVYGTSEGRPRLWLSYYVYDEDSGEPLAKMEATDTMAAGNLGRGAEGFLIVGAEKLNRRFINYVLKDKPDNLFRLRPDK